MAASSLAPAQRGNHRRRAIERHHLHVDARGGFEQLGREILGGADLRRAEIELARIGTRVSKEIAQRFEASPSFTTMARSNVASIETGAKSGSVSNGNALNSAALTAVPLEISSIVWPSGSARATVSPATMPPAPGLFSMMTLWPSGPEIFCRHGARREVGRPSRRIGHHDLERPPGKGLAPSRPRQGCARGERKQ